MSRRDGTVRWCHQGTSRRRCARSLARSTRWPEPCSLNTSRAEISTDVTLHPRRRSLSVRFPVPAPQSRTRARFRSPGTLGNPVDAPARTGAAQIDFGCRAAPSRYSSPPDRGRPDWPTEYRPFAQEPRWKVKKKFRFTGVYMIQPESTHASSSTDGVDTAREPAWAGTAETGVTRRVAVEAFSSGPRP